MISSNPFQVCTSNETYVRYYLMTVYYNNLTTVNDTRNNPTLPCSDNYLSKNQQSVILNILKSSNEIWEAANCNDCYNGTNSINQTFANHTSEIWKLHENYSNCMGTIKDPVLICHDCERFYSKLNAKFENEKKLRGGNICFDLEDIVSTRLNLKSGLF